MNKLFFYILVNWPVVSIALVLLGAGSGFGYSWWVGAPLIALSVAVAFFGFILHSSNVQ